ncbi:MAG: DNA integrity scanning protein DisA nucleotide-binding domain protein [Myxococcales bacterium]|nr:DNA integrity scanning protein DisA nucleotide-binding domain protein [Myxococcales bacterium]
MSHRPTHAYPRDLVRFAARRWPEGRIPDEDGLAAIVETAYHASFLREEDRPVVFRAIVCEPDEVAAEVAAHDSLHVLRFATTRPFDEQEVRRLSQAATYERALIGVSFDQGSPVIWGIVHTGPRWLQTAPGNRAMQKLLPDCVALRVARPGHVALSWGDRPVAELRQGVVGDSRVDVFGSRWLASRFVDTRAEVSELHTLVNGGIPAVDPDVTRLIGQQLIRRVVAIIRGAHHGGTLLIVPPDCAAALVEGRYVRLKYPFAEHAARSRFRQLLLPMLREVASLAGPTEDAGTEHYLRALAGPLRELDDSMFELAQLIASLAQVDGAVVLDKRFGIMGFGGEIAGDLAAVATVRRSLDLEGTRYEEEIVDRVGTRHRSAYRLCNRFHGALAVVVSQDGTVRFVSWHDGGVTYWDHAALGLSESA